MSDNIRLDIKRGVHGFTSVENKGILWDLMYNNGTFVGLTPDMVGDVKVVFEKVIVDNETSQDSETNKNKRVLMTMTERIREMKLSLASSMPVTAGDLSAQRRLAFDNNLSNRQKEFEQLANKPVPKQIDFSDETDSPLLGNMDNIISEAIAKRERDFNMVSKEQNNNPSGGSTSVISSLKTELKIGDIIPETNIMELAGKPPSGTNSKRVSFVSDSNNIPSNNDITNNDIKVLYQLLRVVDEKQDKIIKMLVDIAAAAADKNAIAPEPDI